MKILTFLLLACGCAVGSAQITLSGSSATPVKLAWTAPLPQGTWLGCTTSAPCAYQVFALRGQTCPATVVGSAGWVYVGQTSGLALTDSVAAPGTIVSYVAYTLQGGYQSAPSVCITVTVQNVPQAPTNLVQQ